MFEPFLIGAGIILATGLTFATGSTLALMGVILALLVVVLFLAGGLAISSMVVGGLVVAFIITFLIVMGLIILGFFVASTSFFGFIVVPLFLFGFGTTFAAIFLAVFYTWRYFKGRVNVVGKSVFISGCDSGFGHDLALKLDKAGMRVYAGCLTRQGIEELAVTASPTLVPILCDISLEEDVAHAANIVERYSPEGLYALVNNAGVLYLGEWDWLPKEYLRQTMEVNFFGHVNVTQAFLPQLKKTKGRIVNVSSLAGFLAPKYLGSYACSKYALEAFSDSLRRELDKWEIGVFVVEPSPMNTPMLQSRPIVLERIWNDLDEVVKQEYGHFYYQELESSVSSTPGSPDTVVKALYDKITLKNPSLRSRVGKFKYTLPLILTQALPTFLGDLILKLGKNPLPAALAQKWK